MKEVKFDAPLRPPLVKLINGLSPILQVFNVVPKNLDYNQLLEKAKRKTNLSDFGNSKCLEGLKILLQSLQEEGPLNPTGRLVAEQMILNALTNRLEIIHFKKQNPSITKEKITKPFFILGLPRTGTTLLHYLLALDPESRHCPTWESFHPCPPPKPEFLKSDKRISKTKRELALFWQLIPNVRAVHDFDHLTPQECIVFMSHTLNSFAIATQFVIPKYMKWLASSDLNFLYTEHKSTLQFMQSQGHRRKRWVLKAPAHLFCVDHILQVYPDACIIQTHREPLRAIASSCSLNYALAQLTKENIDIHDVGKLHLEVLSEWLNINCTHRKKHEDKTTQFYDVSFNTFVKNPVSEIKNIYRHFDVTITEEFLSTMNQYITNDKHHAHGKHVYSPEQFGLNTSLKNDKIKMYEKQFAPYLT